MIKYKLESLKNYYYLNIQKAEKDIFNNINKYNISILNQKYENIYLKREIFKFIDNIENKIKLKNTKYKR